MMKHYSTECSICGGGTNNPNGPCTGHHKMQAAQSAAVPVVGEVVAWECKDYGDGWIIFQDKEIAENYQRQSGCLMNKLVIQPTTSITADELDALRKDAESYRRLVSAAKAEGMQHCTYPDCICPDGVSSGSCNIDLPFCDVVPK